MGIPQESATAPVGIAPFLPNLLHEEALGFDVGFQDVGRVVVLQFKLGEELRRFHRTSPSQTIPPLARPFWRFRVDTARHQFQRLMEFENADADVYYIAPRFSHWTAYERAFQDGHVLDNSLLLKRSEIVRGVQAQSEPSSVHRIVYDRSCRYICFEPIELREEEPDDVARGIRERLQGTAATLEVQIQRLFERPRPDTGPGGLAAPRRERLFARAKRPVDAMAAIIGLEAWSQGAQMIFVTRDT